MSAELRSLLEEIFSRRGVSSTVREYKSRYNSGALKANGIINLIESETGRRVIMTLAEEEESQEDEKH